MSDEKNQSRSFQLYLLSKMRVDPDMLTKAMERLRASGKDMAVAKEAMSLLGFGESGETADLYREVLGVPNAVEQLDDSMIPKVFQGSRSLRFKLSLWTGFDFVINEQPDGFIWDPMFRRASTQQLPSLNSVVDLKPWKFVKEEVTERFGIPQFGDAWVCWEELYYLIPSGPGGSLQKYFLVFDYNLLQSFEVSD
jgi:hypothetical protein